MTEGLTHVPFLAVIVGICGYIGSAVSALKELEFLAYTPKFEVRVLDVFLQHPNELMNLREIARRIDRNPGSASRVLPLLVDKEYVTPTQIGVKIVAYQLNQANTIVNLLLEFQKRLGELETA